MPRSQKVRSQNYRCSADKRFLLSIARTLQAASTDPERASRKLAVKIGLVQPTLEELYQRGVTNEQLQAGFKALEKLGNQPRNPTHRVQYRKAQTRLWQELLSGQQLTGHSHQPHSQPSAIVA